MKKSQVQSPRSKVVLATLLMACLPLLAGDVPKQVPAHSDGVVGAGTLTLQAQEPKRRLESITWHADTHKLTWVVEHGTGAYQSFKGEGKKHYEIDLDAATMTFEGQTRTFTHEEATAVHAGMNTLVRYAIESVIWWEEGKGDPLPRATNTVPSSRSQVPNLRR